MELLRSSFRDASSVCLRLHWARVLTENHTTCIVVQLQPWEGMQTAPLGSGGKGNGGPERALQACSHPAPQASTRQGAPPA